MDRIKIYVLHYSCGTCDERITCRNNACDLCSQHNKLYYTEEIITREQLYKELNIPAFNEGNYKHISIVKPKGWISKEEYDKHFFV